MQELPTWVEIDLDALIENVELVRREVTSDVQIMMTVKADAYGHGAVQVARAVEDRVDRFGVATIDEAIELSTAGIEKKILILSPILAKEIPMAVAGRFITTVSSYAFAREVSACAVAKSTEAEVHIEVDTGMGRTGVMPSDVDDLLGRVTKLAGIRCGGLFTHFPVSESDPGFTRKQVREFRKIVERIESTGMSIPVLHSANSAAIPSVPESHMTMVRPGLSIYGHYPTGASRRLPVRPVMSWKCRIVQIRHVPAGTPISYGKSFVTKRTTKVAVIPVGYGHGYPFRLSNRGAVIVEGHKVPIIGRVTMDMTMVDLTDVAGEPRPGDEVVLVGSHGPCEITVDQIADWAGTISYEILTGISKRVPRKYLRDGEVQVLKSLLGVTAKKGSS
ncbi:MAG: alanine racemase [Candidatus Krumholzibacteria bacterium]|nr:alanine racemase [Candidatus Krumholzibacteria bacterium]